MPRLTLGLVAAGAIFCTIKAVAEPRPPLAPWPEQTLGVWGFDGDYGFANFDRTIFGLNTAERVESWSGYALVRDLSSSNGPVALPAMDGTATNLAGSGAIRFWFDSDWSSADIGGSGPGDFARLLEWVDFGGKKPQTRWALYVNPSGTRLYFSGRVNNGNAGDFLKLPVSFQAGHWRMITLCYSPTNSALFLDGALAATGTGVAPPAPWEFASQGLVIGSDVAGANTAQGRFDQLVTFDYWPDESQEAFYHHGVSRQAALGSIGTPEEEAAKRQWLTAQDQANGVTPLGTAGRLTPRSTRTACGSKSQATRWLYLDKSR